VVIVGVAVRDISIWDGWLHVNMIVAINVVFRCLEVRVVTHCVTVVVLKVACAGGVRLSTNISVLVVVTIIGLIEQEQVVIIRIII